MGCMAALKSPNPSDALLLLRTVNEGKPAVVVMAGILVEIAFGGGFGAELKKLLPPRTEDVVICGAVEVGCKEVKFGNVDMDG